MKQIQIVRRSRRSVQPYLDLRTPADRALPF
jgi:hypothetical protein